uniref:Eva-1-like protein C n=1 Tax=Molossus molossus TaxID=27622 RepID=A0A7J8HYW2_MOLMO|nr:eva-1-like protein C [Molossus molossus]
MLLPGPARPPPTPQPAQHPGLRRQVEPPGQLLRLFYCTVLVCSREIAALTDFSGYLSKLLQNHTAYACDGAHLTLRCPRHSAISVQSAFYGHGHRACGAQQPAAQREDGLTCVAPTTFQKVLDECQNQRACHLLVNSRVFGPDLCPGRSKYLLVSFKCEPNELKNQTVCEDRELKLHCHESKFLNIYSATYGRRAQDRDVCAAEAERLPPFVPKNILTAIDPAVADASPAPEQRDGGYGVNIDPSGSRVPKKDGVLVSNSLAAFAYVRAHPERAALLFVSSVCIGLALTLCTLVIRVSCAKDLQKLQLARERLAPGRDEAEEDSADAEQGEDSSDSDFPGEPPGFGWAPQPAYTSVETAELAERIERREQVIREIWMNSGLDASMPRSTGPFH